MELDLRSPKALHGALEAAGFRRARKGSGYRLNGLWVKREHRWLTVQANVQQAGEAPGSQFGRPGLWKMVAQPKPKRPRREFHLPLAVLLEGAPLWAHEDDAQTPLQACLDWAAVTAQGQVPSGWKSPPRELVESWIPSRGLVIQSGPLLRQGSLCYGPNRLGLCFPIAGEVPEAMSPARRDWLRQVLADAENRWRMVRVGLDAATERPAVKAEVDFSGAPHEVLAALFQAGLDAIRWVVSWSLWSVAFLCDTRVSCRAWEGPGAGPSPQKGG